MTRVLVIGDMHVGGRSSIMPEKAYNDDNPSRANEIYPNDLQKFLLTEWKKMCKHHVDICLLMGDLVDGTNNKEQGEGNWTNDISVQIESAARLIEMTGASEYYGVQGSPYHSGLNSSADADVLSRLNGYFDNELLLNIENVKFYLKHVTSHSSVAHSRSTGLNREMVNTDVQRKTYGEIDVHLRAHVHYAHTIIWENVMGMTVPCWKFKDGFLARGQVAGCDMGYVLFDVDGSNYNWNLTTFKIPKSLGVREIDTGVHK